MENKNKSVETIIAVFLFIAFPVGGMIAVENGHTQLVMFCGIGFVWTVCAICFGLND